MTAQAQPRRPGEMAAAALASYLEDHGVTTEAGPGTCRVTATYGGRSMVLCQARGWWCHERPTTGATVLDRMTPLGMEWVTARHVAAMLTSGYGVSL